MTVPAMERSILDEIAEAESAERAGPPGLTPLSHAKRRERDKVRLVPVLRTLVARRGGEGIIAADVIAAGITGGVFTGEEWRNAQRAYSWIGPWLKGLALRGYLAPLMVGPVQVRRYSTRDRSHGNSQLTWIAGERWPAFDEDAAVGTVGRHEPTADAGGRHG